MLLRGHPAGVAVWNKLYRSGLKEQLRFAEGHVYEGKVPLFRALLSSNRVSFLPDRLYDYTFRPGSISQTISLAHERDRIYSVEQLENVIRNLAPQLVPELLSFKLKLYALTWMELQYCEGPEAAKYARSLRDYLKGHVRELERDDPIQTLAVLLSVYAPGICRFGYRLVGRRY